MKPLRYHSGARAEIQKAHDWYLKQSVDAADGFFEELIPAIDRIQEAPGLYPAYSLGTRRLVLHFYPFSVIYRERPHDIQIIAVAHAKRRPGYWAKRLN